jgi:hypothetical protein
MYIRRRGAIRIYASVVGDLVLSPASDLSLLLSFIDLKYPNLRSGLGLKLFVPK